MNIMRESAQKHLPARAFLKRDRGDCLLVSNAPFFDSAPDSVPGFIVIRRGALLHLLPDESWVAHLEQNPPADFLSRSLLRFRGAQTDIAGLSLLSEGIKLLAGCASSPEAALWEQRLRQRAALALRGGCPGGALYVCALIAAQLKKQQGGN